MLCVALVNLFKVQMRLGLFDPLDIQVYFSLFLFLMNLMNLMNLLNLFLLKTLKIQRNF